MRTWPLILAVLAVWVLLTTGAAGIEATLAVFFTLLLFSLPGIPLIGAIAGGWSPSRPLPWLVGLFAGIVLSALLNALVAASFGWSPGTSGAGIVLLAGSLFVILGRREASEGDSLGPSLDRRELVFLGAVMLPMLITIAIPLARVGELVDGQHQYYSLLAHDYLMRGSFSMAVLRELPPHDMFFASEQMNNYFLFYSILAYAISLVGPDIPVDKFVAAADMVLPVLFVVSFYLLARAFLITQRTAQAVVLIGVFAYSYNGLYVLAKRVFLPLFPPVQSFFQSRGLLSFSDISHGLYRDFLVEPHSVFALTLFVVFLSLVWAQRNAAASPFVSLCSGVVLAGSFMSDSFVGLMGIAWFALDGLIGQRRVPFSERLRQATPILGSFGVCIALGLGVGLCSLGSDQSRLVIAAQGTVWKLAPLLFPLALGPSLLLGMRGLQVLKSDPSARKRYEETVSLLLLLMLSTAMSLLVQHNDPAFWSIVFRKSLKGMQIPLLLLSGITLASWKEVTEGLKSRLVWVTLIGLGLTTLFVDLSAFSGFYDADETSTVSEADFGASAWVRQNVPRESIVQSLPESPDGDGYKISPIAMLAGRAMGLGNLKMARLSSPSESEFQLAIEEIGSLFRSSELARVVAVLDKYCIDYVYVGPSERDFGGSSLMDYASHAGRFSRVYSEHGVEIFRVLRQRPPPTCRVP